MLALLLREKPVRIFLTLKNTEGEWYLSKLARSAQVTFVYLSILVPRLQQRGLLRVEKKGKKRIVALTEKGLEVAQLLEELKRRLDIKEVPKEAKPAEGAKA